MQGGYGGPPGGYGQPPGGGGYGQPPGGGGYGQPPGGFGPPPQGPGGFQPQGPQGGPPGGEPPNNIGLIIAGVWLAFGVFGCLATGVAGAMSETLGMNISYIGVPLFVSGAFAMSIAPFVRTRGQGPAIGAPLGCGCLGFFFAFILLGVFFQVIWPEL